MVPARRTWAGSAAIPAGTRHRNSTPELDVVSDLVTVAACVGRRVFAAAGCESGVDDG
jgi:hypothetical protein